MSTNSTVSVFHKDGSVSMVYGHWDGGLWKNGVGDTLINNYQALTLIEELIDFGDFSSLSQDTYTSVFYGRDRGEKNTDTTRFKNVDDWKFELRFNAEYKDRFNYVFIDRVWYLIRDRKLFTMDTVAEALKEYERFDRYQNGVYS